jgi:hypothetical protein
MGDSIEKNEKPEQKEKNKYDSFIRYSSLAFEMMAIIVVGTLLRLQNRPVDRKRIQGFHPGAYDFIGNRFSFLFNP